MGKILYNFSKLSLTLQGIKVKSMFVSVQIIAGELGGRRRWVQLRSGI